MSSVPITKISVPLLIVGSFLIVILAGSAKFHGHGSELRAHEIHIDHLTSATASNTEAIARLTDILQVRMEERFDSIEEQLVYLDTYRGEIDRLANELERLREALENEP